MMTGVGNPQQYHTTHMLRVVTDDRILIVAAEEEFFRDHDEGFYTTGIQ